MKFIFVLLVSLVAGCASAPKVGQKSDASYSIVIAEGASNALMDLQSVGVVGVRDLTLKESARYEDDRHKFGAASNARDGMNAGAYSLSTSAAAVAGGLSLSSVTGVGLLSAMLADERPDNYSFALDFNDKYFIASVGGVDIDLLLSAVNESVLSSSQLFESAHGIKATASVFVRERSVSLNWLEPDRKHSGAGIGVNDKCMPGEKRCQLNVWSSIRKMNSRSPLEASLLVGLMSKLPESYFLYIPPNRSIYQLPAVIYGGGRVEYLVEAE